MRIKNAIKKIAVPFLATHGFSLRDVSAGYYEFNNEDDTRRITIEIGPYMPKSLKTLYSYKKDSSMISFHNYNLGWLVPEAGTNGEFFYSSQEELEEAVKQILDISFSQALPRLESLMERYVDFPRHLYALLKEDTKERAASFAEKHNLTIPYSRENIKKVESSLLEMRGEDETRWKERFRESEAEIVDMAAYIGEVVRRSAKKRPKWKWVEEDSFYAPNECYYLRSEGVFSPLERIVSFWNYYTNKKKFDLVNELYLS